MMPLIFVLIFSGMVDSQIIRVVLRLFNDILCYKPGEGTNKIASFAKIACATLKRGNPIGIGQAMNNPEFMIAVEMICYKCGVGLFSEYLSVKEVLCFVGLLLLHGPLFMVGSMVAYIEITLNQFNRRPDFGQMLLDDKFVFGDLQKKYYPVSILDLRFPPRTIREPLPWIDQTFQVIIDSTLISEVQIFLRESGINSNYLRKTFDLSYNEFGRRSSINGDSGIIRSNAGLNPLTRGMVRRGDELSDDNGLTDRSIINSMPTDRSNHSIKMTQSGAASFIPQPQLTKVGQRLVSIPFYIQPIQQNHEQKVPYLINDRSTGSHPRIGQFFTDQNRTVAPSQSFSNIQTNVPNNQPISTKTPLHYQQAASPELTQRTTTIYNDNKQQPTLQLRSSVPSREQSHVNPNYSAQDQSSTGNYYLPNTVTRVNSNQRYPQIASNNGAMHISHLDHSQNSGYAPQPSNNILDTSMRTQPVSSTMSPNPSQPLFNNITQNHVTSPFPAMNYENPNANTPTFSLTPNPSIPLQLRADTSNSKISVHHTPQVASPVIISGENRLKTLPNVQEASSSSYYPHSSRNSIGIDNYHSNRPMHSLPSEVSLSNYQMSSQNPLNHDFSTLLTNVVSKYLPSNQRNGQAQKPRIFEDNPNTISRVKGSYSQSTTSPQLSYAQEFPLHQTPRATRVDFPSPRQDPQPTRFPSFGPQQNSQFSGQNYNIRSTVRDTSPNHLVQAPMVNPQQTPLINFSKNHHHQHNPLGTYSINEPSSAYSTTSIAHSSHTKHPSTAPPTQKYPTHRPDLSLTSTYTGKGEEQLQRLKSNLQQKDTNRQPNPLHKPLLMNKYYK